MSKTASIDQPPIPSLSNRKVWFHLPGSSQALAIAHLIEEPSVELLVIITHTILEAQQLEDELQFFIHHHDHSFPIFNFPDWETLPYDHFSTTQEIISQRLKILSQLLSVKKGILIIPITTLMQRIVPTDYLVKNVVMLKVKQVLNIDLFRRSLLKNGYAEVDQVMQHGEIAIRGSVIDLYPMGTDYAFRIDLLDDVIDSIRTFEPETQRSIEKIDYIRVLPAHEILLDKESIRLFRENFEAYSKYPPLKSELYENISNGFYVNGIEYYLPWFFPKTATLFDYISEKSILILNSALFSAMQSFWAIIHDRYEQLNYNIERPILAPQQLFLSLKELEDRFHLFRQIYLDENDEIKSTNTQPKTDYSFSIKKLDDIHIDAQSSQPLTRLNHFLTTHKDFRVLYSVESKGRQEYLIQILKTIYLHLVYINDWKTFLESSEKCAITLSFLEEGFIDEEKKIILITEKQLFPERIIQRQKHKLIHDDISATIQNLTELHIGDPIVHVEHGVGRFVGLSTLTVDHQIDEYLTIEYANQDKLHVPVSSLHLVSRYTGVDAEHAPLHHLGSVQWTKAKAKAEKRIQDVAAELLDIYAQRSLHQRPPFLPPDQNYLRFVENFPFEETQDQQKAIDAIIEDMKKENPMDRLVCGDVGFGKTEVAMRAAFLTVQNHQQVAVLVPTTLLAQQHYQTFLDRFATWPIKIEVLSRFRTSTAQKKILQDLARGQIDILIGTHKLLQPYIQFKNLGLLIIDEEHRFGVKQKEHIKALRSTVDIITLTATPIPRTLNMAFSNLRDLSIIATPPERRLSIKTFLYEYQPSIIKEAVLRELSRGGQVYFLHNKVETIEKITEELKKLLPGVRIRIAHGQMHERELENIMVDFYHQRFNVLVCTTIIESGIDIPTSNTIIINQANHFGLAQLHQLRGRVGRSHRQAYAYLLVHSKQNLTSDSKKRLEAIEKTQDLGAGFILATHDMEIRGVGELLGQEQSGHIQAIGFTLYTQMLQQAMQSLQKGQTPNYKNIEETQTDIDLKIPAIIPENYVPSVPQRLILYKRIANASNQNLLDDLRVEIIDRFGLLPEPTKNLFEITSIKLKATTVSIKKIQFKNKIIQIIFQEKPNINVPALLQFIQTHAEQYQLKGSNVLAMKIDNEDKGIDIGPKQLFSQIENFLRTCK
jgi:transcription-repair coupling factor (superfamily II helicase)